MAIKIEVTGKTTEASNFNYNQKLKYENEKFVQDKNSVNLGQGDAAYAYSDDFKASTFRDTKSTDPDVVDDIFGGTRNGGVVLGNVTKTGEFSYNGGSPSNSDKPAYLDDKWRTANDSTDAPYAIGGIWNVHSVRNEE